VEERPVSELRLSEAEALRRIFHTRKLTAPKVSTRSLTPRQPRNRATATPAGDPIGLGFLQGGSCTVALHSERTGWGHSGRS
jgi:hypothetical protein